MTSRMTGPDCAAMYNLLNTHTHIQRRGSTGNRTRVVDFVWETGETWFGGKRKKCRKERVGPVAADNPDNLENKKEEEGEAQGN